MNIVINRRDCSIDILKFLAVFLIINSHMDALYPKFKILATGGAIGDVLFLFVSGYTLFLSNRKLRFDNWYKRRINRIYPSVIICVLMGALLQKSGTLPVLQFWGGEFVVAIMSYYIILYGIKQYLIKYVPYTIVTVGIISVVVYCIWFPYKYETGEKGLYGITTLFRWLPYFDFMLFGAWIGINREKLEFKPICDFVCLFGCVIAFYGIQLLAKMKSEYAPWQIVTLVPLLGITFYFYKWCNANFWNQLYQKPLMHGVIMTISGLCLESYLIQYSCFTTKMNSIFPLNLPIMIIIVLMVSYVCKCLSRWFLQTFSNNNYDWKEIVRFY